MRPIFRGLRVACGSDTFAHCGNAASHWRLRTRGSGGESRQRRPGAPPSVKTSEGAEEHENGDESLPKGWNELDQYLAKEAERLRRMSYDELLFSLYVDGVFFGTDPRFRIADHMSTTGQVVALATNRLVIAELRRREPVEGVIGKVGDSPVSVYTGPNGPMLPFSDLCSRLLERDDVPGF